MIPKHSVMTRLILIRATFPLILLAVLWSRPSIHVFILGLAIVSALDVLGVVLQNVIRPNLWDCQFAAVRDVVYALTYYIVFIQNPQIPDLVLIPTVLAEVFVLFGYRVFFTALILEMTLLVVRMATIYHAYHLIHPTWAMLIGVASVVMGLLGLEIKHLEELQVEITEQQEHLKNTLTEMLATTLSPSGIDEELLRQENISPMIEEICHEANQSKGREIGRRLAQIIAVKQAAANLFTSRELEVIILVSQNKSYRQIAEQIQVSEGTVRAHAASIMRKADVHSRDELVAWAREHRLLADAQSQESASDSSEVLNP